MDEYYQPTPRRIIREPKVRESRVDLPLFHGKEDVDAYLDWEMKVEQIFTCHQVGEEIKVPLATLAFQGQAMYWWTTLVRERRLNNDPPIEYWNDLRSAMRRRYIPSYYRRELMDKLQRLQQKNMSVEEYRQKMKLYLMRVRIRGEERLTIARFLKQQLRRKSSKNLNSKSYKEDSKRERNSFKNYSKENPSKTQEIEKDVEKEKITSQTSSKMSEIKCFKCQGRGHIASQCPTKKTMILSGKDIYSEDKEKTSDHEIEKLYPVDGDLLMVKRLLGSQPCSISLSQRENIFHTRCLVSKRPCRPLQFDKHTIHDGRTNKISFTHKDRKIVFNPLTPPQVFEDQKQMKRKRKKRK
uniref:CCHC-type domain-containing protein n=1 Tax=Cajanus cajan TaxID=3821 RepID=A0A151UF97_CAJCA